MSRTSRTAAALAALVLLSIAALVAGGRVAELAARAIGADVDLRVVAGAAVLLVVIAAVYVGLFRFTLEQLELGRARAAEQLEDALELDRAREARRAARAARRARAAGYDPELHELARELAERARVTT